MLNFGGVIFMTSSLKSQDAVSPWFPPHRQTTKATSAALPFASAAASFLAAATLPAGVGRCGMVWNFGGTKFFGSFLVGG